jgi:hypothetical protein
MSVEICVRDYYYHGQRESDRGVYIMVGKKQSKAVAGRGQGKVSLPWTCSQFLISSNQLPPSTFPCLLIVYSKFVSNSVLSTIH